MPQKLTAESALKMPHIFNDGDLDFMDQKERQKLLTILFRNQVAFMKQQVPYYAHHYKNVDPKKIQSFDDCLTIPTLMKDDIRNLASPYDLLPTSIRSDFSKVYLYRGTGGTTGEPTSMFFSYNDWQAILGGMSRSLQELKKLKKQIICFNGYNQGHISGPIFDDTIRKIGDMPIARHFGSDDERAIRQMVRHKCNMIIAPPISTHKGGSVENLLEADAKLGTNYINGKNIDCIFCSSTNLTQEVYKELQELGIKLIYNYYGSTDALPTAISCQASPFDLHILQGHISLFVKGKDHKHVKSGQRGLVIAGRTASYDAKGLPTTNEATQLLNYHVGDEVTFIDEPCSCGRTSPRIKDVQRVSFIQDKLEGGCEHW